MAENTCPFMLSSLLFCFAMEMQEIPTRFAISKFTPMLSNHNRVKNSATHASTRMECFDTPSSLTSKPPDEHVASPIFHYVDLIAQGQDCCSRQCIVETASQNRRHSNTAREPPLSFIQCWAVIVLISSCVSQRHYSENDL